MVKWLELAAATQSRSRLGHLIGMALMALACAGAMLPTSAQERSRRSAAELMDVVMWGKEPIGGPFTLIDHTGRTRTDADFRGRHLLVYFGFTYCPDICPTDLQTIGAAVDSLGAEAERVQPLFITVDPERDTVDHLALYVPSFHPRLVGLTGDADQIRQATEAYKVYFAKVTEGNSTTIDHSSFIYLMGPDGRYLGFFPPSTPADRLAQVLRSALGSSADGQ